MFLILMFIIICYQNVVSYQRIIIPKKLVYRSSVNENNELYKIKENNELYKIKENNELYKIKENNELYKIKENNELCKTCEQLEKYEEIEKEILEVFQKMRKHNLKNVYTTTNELYKLFKKKK